MGWVALATAIFQLILEIFRMWKEGNDETKKKKTEIQQSILRGIVDRDASRISGGFDQLNRMRDQG